MTSLTESIQIASRVSALGGGAVTPLLLQELGFDSARTAAAEQEASDWETAFKRSRAESQRVAERLGRRRITGEALVAEVRAMRDLVSVITGGIAHPEATNLRATTPAAEDARRAFVESRKTVHLFNSMGQNSLEYAYDIGMNEADAQAYATSRVARQDVIKDVMFLGSKTFHEARAYVNRMDRLIASSAAGEHSEGRRMESDIKEWRQERVQAERDAARLKAIQGNGAIRDAYRALLTGMLAELTGDPAKRVLTGRDAGYQRQMHLEAALAHAQKHPDASLHSRSSNHDILLAMHTYHQLASEVTNEFCGKIPRRVTLAGALDVLPIGSAPCFIETGKHIDSLVKRDAWKELAFTIAGELDGKSAKLHAVHGAHTLHEEFLTTHGDDSLTRYQAHPVLEAKVDVDLDASAYRAYVAQVDSELGKIAEVKLTVPGQAAAEMSAFKEAYIASHAPVQTNVVAAPAAESVERTAPAPRMRP
jgi:hypothetical protein